MTKAKLRGSELLKSTLEGLTGVRGVIMDDGPEEIILVCETGARATVEAAARLALEEDGIDPDSVDLVIAHVPLSDGQRRVRFRGLTMETPVANYSRARAVLEWQGDEHEGLAQGEGGAPVELRVCALATIEALQSVVGEEVTFQLVGIKAIRIFDHDLVAALLHSPQASDRRLIGVSLVVDDIRKCAALAVLNATNRLLGNYLVAD